jgi:hypothetical protein
VAYGSGDIPEHWPTRPSLRSASKLHRSGFFEVLHVPRLTVALGGSFGDPKFGLHSRLATPRGRRIPRSLPNLLVVQGFSGVRCWHGSTGGWLGSVLGFCWRLSATLAAMGCRGMWRRGRLVSPPRRNAVRRGVTRGRHCARDRRAPPAGFTGPVDQPSNDSARRRYLAHPVRGQGCPHARPEGPVAPP